MPSDPPAILTGPSAYAAPSVPTLWLRALDSEVQRARRFTTDMLDVLVPPEHLSDVVLCVSELVTNAVRAAARCADAGDTPVHLGITGAALWTRLDVRDPDRSVPVPSMTDPLGVSGRGLLIVDLIAVDVWSTIHADHKVMHAIIPMPDVKLTADELAEARK